MAELLRSYDWTFTSKNNPHARSRLYPWDEWLDGRIRRLTQGDDFDGPAVSVERVIRTSAHRKGVKVRVRVESPESIILQAHAENARNMARGVTKSPSGKDVKAAREAGNGPAAGPVSKRPTKAAVSKTAKTVTKAPKPNVNGNASKRRIVKAGA